MVCVCGGGFVLQKCNFHKISGLKGPHAAEGRKRDDHCDPLHHSVGLMLWLISVLKIVTLIKKKNKYIFLLKTKLLTAVDQR